MYEIQWVLSARLGPSCRWYGSLWTRGLLYSPVWLWQGPKLGDQEPPILAQREQLEGSARLVDRPEPVEEHSTGLVTGEQYHKIGAPGLAMQRHKILAFFGSF